MYVLRAQDIADSQHDTMDSIATPISYPHTFQFTGNQFGSDESSSQTCGGPYPPALSHDSAIPGIWTRGISPDLGSITHRTKPPSFSQSSTTGASTQQRGQNPLAIEPSYGAEFASILHDSSEPYNVGDALLRPAKTQDLTSMLDNAAKTVASEGFGNKCSRCDRSFLTKRALK